MEACALNNLYVIIQKTMSPRKSEEAFKFCRSKEGVCERTSLVKILQSCHFNIFGINPRCLRKMSIKKNSE